MITLAACTKGKLVVTATDILPAPTLNQQNIQISSMSPFNVSGTCDSHITDIQFSVDNGNTWYDAAKMDSSAQFLCAKGGTYSFMLNPAAVTVAPNSTVVTFWVRGQSINQVSNLAIGTVTYSSGLAKIFRSGVANVMAGTTYSVSGHFSGTPFVAGTTYGLRGILKHP